MKIAVKLAMIALATVSLACVKENPQEEQPVPSDPNKVVFTASVPTKTTIDAADEVVSWAAGDEVKFVWAGGSATAAASSAGASTTFTVEVGEGITELYAVYPASAGGSYDEGNVNVHFNGVRTDGSFAANDICVAKATKNGDSWNTSLAFKNVACLLKVGVTSNEIAKLQVKGVNDEVVSGVLPVNIDGGTVSYGEVTSAGTSMNMTVSGPGNYYIPILPDVTFSEGFRLNLITDETDPANIVQKTPFFYNGSFTTSRGQIIKMADIEGRAGHYYVTPAGAGSKAGQSWNNAMSAAQFKSFVENQDNFFLLRGATFHFSAEEFSFGDDYVKPSYPDHSNVNFTIEGTVTATDTTTFLGRTALSGTTAGVLWPQHSSYITIKNVKFTGTNGASNASVIRLNNSAKELTLDHCYFRNNRTSGNGGAISLFNSAKVTIKDCSFSGNTGAGGLIHVNNTSAKVFIQDTEVKGCSKNAVYVQDAQEITFTRVTFKDNDDAGEYGAAAFFGNGTTDCTISFIDCDFIRNHSTNRGGAIGIKGAYPTVRFTDCDFIGNSADQMGGAVYIYSGNATTTFTGGKFQDNHADGTDNTKAAGAAIYAEGAGVVFDCTDVLFNSNYSDVGANEYSGGVIRVEQDGGIARLNGCVFDGNYTYRSSSVNPACAAVVNSRTKEPIYYFNACEFKNNASGTYAGTGAKYGMLMAMYTAGTIAMNNCSVHDNYGGRNTDPIDWIYIDSADATLFLSNSSVIGDPMRKTSATGSASVKNTNGVIYLSKNGKFYFINNVLCSPTGKSLNCAASITIEKSYYNKTSPVNGMCDWGTDTGSGHDYYASSSCFGGWTMPYTWNGTLTGTNSNMLAATADVNAEIQNADADFYAWLNTIGALGKDIAGNSRGATSWPGCYQK